jgi:F0F1-type ATP synthase assembly protein I
MQAMEFPLNSQKNVTYIKNLALVGAFSWIGFLTLVIAVSALLGGMWLDAQWGTKPIFTVGLLIASIPLNIYIQFRTAINVAKQIQAGMPNSDSKSEPQKDE